MRRLLAKTSATGTVVLLLMVSAAGSAGAQPGYPEPGLVTGDVSVHDPSMVRVADGTYYVYSTHEGLQARSSTDRTAFTRAGAALPGGAPWAAQYTGGDPRALWAPDVSYHGGRYWMYYSASTFGSNHSAIGMATSPTGAPGSWQDQGPVYTSASGDDYNAIDPNLVTAADGGRWMVFGSHWSGIKLIEIDPSTGTQASWNTTRYNLAQTPTTQIEGPNIFARGGYYYLFVSVGQCCSGVDSTYRVLVGRSTDVTGPYVDRSGQPMLNGGGTVVLETHGQRVVGPGGQVVLGDEDNDLVVYHYYDRFDNGAPKLGINFLGWDGDGWPYAW